MAEEARGLWLSAGLPESALSSLVLEGDPDTSVKSSFKLGVAAQVSIGILGLAAAHVHFLRTGVAQNVTVDARHAILASHSEAYYTVDGKLPQGEIWDSIAGLYRTKDDGFVRIHTNFPHHRLGTLSILQILDSPSVAKAEVQAEILKWNKVDFETEAAARNMCVTAMRSFAEWDCHPQARALVGVSPVTITKIGEAPKRQSHGNPDRPLDGIRVLDLSRVLAGPVAGRSLAAHGADVLLVTSPNLPDLPLLDVETSLGKRTTQLDLTTQSDRETLTTLVKNTDVFLQAYRPGGLAEKGFGPQELATLRPGIVCASLTAWGWDGSWSDRRGFDSLVQTATGFNVAESQAFNEYSGKTLADNEILGPRPLPYQALDHAAGYFLAFGINAALCKTTTEGGSWEVRVSLAAVGQWIRSLGRLAPGIAFGRSQDLPGRDSAEVAQLSVTWPKAKGERDTDYRPQTITALRHAAILSATPAKEGEFGEAPMGLNVHKPVWRS